MRHATGLLLSITALLSLGTTEIRAQVTVPSVWASHAVVQRDEPVRVWGRAAAGEHVAVAFRGARIETTAGATGRWRVDLPAGAAGGPFTMTIDGSNHIALTDLLVGDVWLVSGQSNMEFQTKYVINADQELKSANDPFMRLFHIERASADYPQEDVKAQPWTEATPASVAGFSAVAYFFARSIRADQKVPIGLIEADWGGTPIEAWISLRGLSSDGALQPAWRTWAAMAEGEPEALLIEKKEIAEHDAALKAGKPAADLPWHPEFRSWLPGGLFNGMIAPVIPFSVRGFLWYQGESNAGVERSFYYEAALHALIDDLRMRFEEGNLPFLFVQLANLKTSPESKWPELREAQRRTLNVANTAMAVTIDIGDPANIHPKNKQEVGRRLALGARAIAYGEPVEFSGPAFRTAALEGSSMRVSFDHVRGGLRVHGAQLTGFEVAGRDGKFRAAEARLDGQTVVVTSSGIPEPVAVRYGWAGNPACNLFNGEDLPASPFTSQP